MSKAIWKAIPGYEGLYEVSNEGIVRSVYRYKRELKPMISNCGYQRVDLFKNKKRRQYSVHRLVATCFCEQPAGANVVNHKDENKLNNKADNLEWVTTKENNNYGNRLKKMVQSQGYKARVFNSEEMSKKASKPIIQCKKDGTPIRQWESASAFCRENGGSVSNIRRVIAKGGTAYGFTFMEVI